MAQRRIVRIVEFVAVGDHAIEKSRDRRRHLERGADGARRSHAVVARRPSAQRDRRGLQAAAVGAHRIIKQQATELIGVAVGDAIIAERDHPVGEI